MTLRAATVAVMLMSATAFAEDKVIVTAEVVQISKKGDVVDPPKLAAMKSEFQKQAATKDFTSFKRLSEQKLELIRGRTERVQVVGQRVLNIRLDELKADT